jgi:hypothetical protein
MLTERAGRTLKRTVIELGGYNPMIILDDVDVDYAVRMAAFESFFHHRPTGHPGRRRSRPRAGAGGGVPGRGAAHRRRLGPSG